MPCIQTQLLAQTLAASTIRWNSFSFSNGLLKNPGLKHQALAMQSRTAVGPEIQSVAGLPEWLSVWQTIFSGRLTWATRSGPARRCEWMPRQRMRKKGPDNGNLKSGEQQRVETKVIENRV